ncbi:MAG TPA: MerR family transcriptional regulator [Chloroflexota bacterium]|nr:MerR family transcriptional regulator [Chloroflexota bacterium]
MYSIAELQSLTGATRRTIHYYVQEGILPSPAGAGPRAAYGEEHRLRLLAVTRLKALGWTLERIRDYFALVHYEEIARLANGGLPLVASELEGLRTVTETKAVPRGETVTHYRVAPGVELLIASSAPDSARQAIERALDLLTQIFVEK